MQRAHVDDQMDKLRAGPGMYKPTLLHKQQQQQEQQLRHQQLLQPRLRQDAAGSTPGTAQQTARLGRPLTPLDVSEPVLGCAGLMPKTLCALSHDMHAHDLKHTPTRPPSILAPSSSRKSACLPSSCLRKGIRLPPSTGHESTSAGTHTCSCTHILMGIEACKLLPEMHCLQAPGTNLYVGVNSGLMPHP